MSRVPTRGGISSDSETAHEPQVGKPSGMRYKIRVVCWLDDNLRQNIPDRE